MPAQYIFTIENLSKAYGKKDVLKNIWLSFYPGSQDRRHRRQRLGQEHALADHGRERDRLYRDRSAGPADLDRLRAAGADTRSQPRRARQRRDRRRTDPCPPDAVRRDQHPARRRPRRRRDGRPARRAGQGSRRHRGGRGVGPRPPRRDRHGRHAAAPRRRPWSARFPAANADASPCARSCSNAPTSCCWTSRPTTSTPKASPGSSGTCRNTPARSSSSPTTATSSTTSPSGSSSSIAARESRGRATIPPGSSKSRPGSPSRKNKKAAGANSSPASSSGSGCRPGRGWPRTGLAFSATSSSPARTPTGATRPSCSRFPPARIWEHWSSRPKTSPRPTATTSSSRE